MARRQVTSPAAMRPRAIFRESTSPPDVDNDRFLQDGTVGARIGQMLRFGGVLVLLVMIVLAALSYDEYETAGERLKRPFDEQNPDIPWSTPSYVEYKKDEAKRELNLYAIIGGAGACALLVGAVDKWRR